MNTDRNAGFTLIELMAVLLLLGLIAAGVSVSLASSHRRAQMSDVVGQVVQYDTLARATAREQGAPMRVRVSLQSSTLSREIVEDARRGERASSLVLPPGYSVGQVRVGTTRTSFGQTSIAVSSLGQTADYAIRIDGKDQRQWVMFVGLSGQNVLLDSDRDAERLFQPPTP